MRNVIHEQETGYCYHKDFRRQIERSKT